MAKLFCSDNCMKHTSNAVQILGGRGYLKGYDVERFFRDAKVLQIYDGASDVQKVIIARHLLAEATGNGAASPARLEPEAARPIVGSGVAG